jgi:hypothetical protein
MDEIMMLHYRAELTATLHGDPAGKPEFITTDVWAESPDDAMKQLRQQYEHIYAHHLTPTVDSDDEYTANPSPEVIAAAAALRADQKRRGHERAATVMANALKVVALDPKISAWLAEHDPKALEQIDNAIAEAEPLDMPPQIWARVRARAEKRAIVAKAPEDLADVLADVSEFLDNYVDVNDGDSGPVPNRAMALQARVDAVREGLR